MSAFKADRVRPGVYKVVPATNMEPREYCSISASRISKQNLKLTNGYRAAVSRPAASSAWPPRLRREPTKPRARSM